MRMLEQNLVERKIGGQMVEAIEARSRMMYSVTCC
jgi:hypothetical protein